MGVIDYQIEIKREKILKQECCVCVSTAVQCDLLLLSSPVCFPIGY